MTNRTKNGSKWPILGPSRSVIMTNYDQNNGPKMAQNGPFWVLTGVTCECAQNRGRRVKMAKGIGAPRHVMCMCPVCICVCQRAYSLPRHMGVYVYFVQICTVPNAYVNVSVDTQNHRRAPRRRARVRTCFVRVSICPRALFLCAREKIVIMLWNIKLLPENMYLLLCIGYSRKWPIFGPLFGPPLWGSLKKGPSINWKSCTKWPKSLKTAQKGSKKWSKNVNKKSVLYFSIIS